MSITKRIFALLATLAIVVSAAVYGVVYLRNSRAVSDTKFAEKMQGASGAFLQSGKIPEAQRVTEQWSEVQPDNAAAWRERGVAAAAANDLPQARSFLERAIRIRPDDAAAQLTLGEVYFAQGEWEKAEIACRVAFRAYPDDAQVQLSLARSLVAQKKNPAEAESLAFNSVTLGDGGAVAYFTLAEALMQQKKTARAQSALVRGLALDPANADGYDLLAQVNRDRNNKTEAGKAAVLAAQIRAFRPDATKVPDPIRLARGEELLRAGEYKAALTQFLDVVRRDITNAGGLEGAALALLGMEDKSTASAYLAQAVLNDPERVRSRIALGLAAYENGLYGGAAENFIVVTRTRPRNALAWHGLGQAYIGQNLFQREAEDALRRAVEIDPNPVFLMDYADILQANSKTPDAEAAYRRAFALDKNDPDVNARFGAFLAMLPPDPLRQKEAQALLENAVKQSPEDSFAQYQLGRLLAEQERYAEAIPQLEKATQKGQGRTKDVWSVLARAYRNTGQKEKSARATAEADLVQATTDRYDRAAERLGSDLSSPVYRLEMARAASDRGEYGRALAEYESYIRRKPADAAVRKERDVLIATLKQRNALPDMAIYNRIGALSEQDKRAGRSSR